MMRKSIVIAFVIALLPATALAAGSITGWGSNVYVPESDLQDLVTIDAGLDHCLALKADGSIVAWGWNWSGACDVPGRNPDFVDVSAGGGGLDAFSLGLTSEGSIVAWGAFSPLPEPNTDFVAISAGRAHSLGLKSDGSIVAWGSNEFGVCIVPTPNTDFVAIAASDRHSLGLKSDGTVIAWGWEYAYCLPEQNSDIVALATSKYRDTGTKSSGIPHNLALKSDGSIAAWGFNGYGQCDVPEPNADFVAISASTGHSLGLKSDGSIVAWGANHSGQCEIPESNTGYTAIAAGGASFEYSRLGGWYYIRKGCSFGLKAGEGLQRWGQTWNVPHPNRDFVQVARGALNGLGLKTDGSVVSWWHVNALGHLVVPEPNAGFIAVSTQSYTRFGIGGSAHHGYCLGLKSDGSIVAWGDGDCAVPEPNAGFVAVSAGYGSKYGLKVDGSVVAWGNNSYGQCDVPQPNEDFVAVDASSGYTFIFPSNPQVYALGVKSDGSIVGWGANSFGQCDVPEPNSGFEAVDAGTAHALGLKSDGSIVAWGDNSYGQCDVPQPNEDFVAVVAYERESAALKSDGTVVTWGNQGGNSPIPNMGFESICAYRTGIRIETPVSIIEQDEQPPNSLPTVTRLISAYPNPFNPQTTVAFTLERDQQVTIDVCNPAGIRVCTLANGIHSAGEHLVTWNGRDASNRTIASGTYIIRLVTEEGVEARKISLVR